VRGIKSGEYGNPNDAAKKIASRANGHSHDAIVDRLRKKIRARMKDAAP